MNYRRGLQRVYAVPVVAFVLFIAGCHGKGYEVIERSQEEVPNFQAPGYHAQVNYVLLHEGHRIYASCDTLDYLDPHATCGFRPLRSYECRLGQDGDLANAKGPLSDLKCKDADGNNVYLYVSKKE